MKDKTILYQWIFVVIASLFIVATTYLYYLKGHLNNGDIEFTKLGTYGDFTGGVLGTILSIVAVILVYKTYISQSRELELNRNILEQQSFENTFFNMLRVHQDLKNNIEFSTENLVFQERAITGTYGIAAMNPKVIKGRTFMNTISKDFTKAFYYPSAYDNQFVINDGFKDEHKGKVYNDIYYKPLKSEENIDYIKFKYDLFFKNYESYLGDYFRNLYHILMFISRRKSDEIHNDMDDRTKRNISKKYRQYSDILQSQMTMPELLLNFYNAFKFKKMKKLIEEFDFLENLHSRNLLDVSHIKLEGFGKIKNN